MKHPCLRVKSVLDLDKSILNELEQLMRQVVALLPVPVLDVEIVGSYANAGANLVSDMDLAVQTESWDDMMKIRKAVYGKDQRTQQAIFALLLPYRDKWGIILEFNPVIPWNKESTDYATYSLFERKLYGTPMDCTKYWLKLNNYTQTYVPTLFDVAGTPVNDFRQVPAFMGSIKVGIDQFADLIDQWRKTYGDKFLETKLVNGELYDADSL